MPHSSHLAVLDGLQRDWGPYSLMEPHDNLERAEQEVSISEMRKWG